MGPIWFCPLPATQLSQLFWFFKPNKTVRAKDHSWSSLSIELFETSASWNLTCAKATADKPFHSDVLSLTYFCFGNEGPAICVAKSSSLRHNNLQKNRLQGFTLLDNWPPGHHHFQIMGQGRFKLWDWTHSWDSEQDIFPFHSHLLINTACQIDTIFALVLHGGLVHANLSSVLVIVQNAL